MGVAFICFVAMVMTVLFAASAVAACWGGCSVAPKLLVIGALGGSAWLIVQAARKASEMTAGGKVLIYAVLVPYSVLTFPALVMAIVGFMASFGAFVVRHVF